MQNYSIIGQGGPEISVRTNRLRLRIYYIDGCGLFVLRIRHAAFLYPAKSVWNIHAAFLYRAKSSKISKNISEKKNLVEEKSEAENF